MKSKVLRFIIAGIIIFFIVMFITYMYTRNKINSIGNHLIEIAEDIVNKEENEDIDFITNEELILNENVIGIIEIPILNLKAPIQEGTTDSILKYAVGHFSNSSYWNGNVCLASHNRGSYVAHYFDSIDRLVNGDEIIYKTKFGERRYEVISNITIKSTDWSVISQTADNQLTLITCVKNDSNLRLCVKAKEI